MIVNGIHLGASDVRRLKNSSKVAQAIENKWDRRIRRAIVDAAKADADRISAGQDPLGPDLEALLVEHYFDTQIQALKLAEREGEVWDRIRRRLAGKPRTLADVMRQYDMWRKRLFTPKKVVKRALDLKKAYIQRIQQAWKRYSADFRNGDVATQEEVKVRIAQAADTTVSRAATIVRTETTRYYNKARKDYYDRGSEVTHYLFLAVRDKATTPWCTGKTTDGKRGRSGLVYAKDDPLLDDETPPCHWNCRSELLPLNQFNPSHRKLIADKSIARRSHQCYPLPPGWSK